MSLPLVVDYTRSIVSITQAEEPSNWFGLWRGERAVSTTSISFADIVGARQSGENSVIVGWIEKLPFRLRTATVVLPAADTIPSVHAIRSLISLGGGAGGAPLDAVPIRALGGGPGPGGDVPPGGALSPRKCIAVICNPISGSGRALQAINGVFKTVFDLGGVPYDLLLTERAGHASILAHNLDISRLEGILVLGGDGTLNEVISGLTTRADWSDVIRLPIGTTHSGTRSAIAEGLGSADHLACALAILHRTTTPLDAMLLVNRAGRRRLSICIIGSGVATRLSEESERPGWKCLGSLRYAASQLLHGVRVVFGCERYRSRVQWSEEGVVNAEELHSLMEPARTGASSAPLMPADGASSTTASAPPLDLPRHLLSSRRRLTNDSFEGVFQTPNLPPSIPSILPSPLVLSSSAIVPPPTTPLISAALFERAARVMSQHCEGEFVSVLIVNVASRERPRQLPSSGRFDIVFLKSGRLCSFLRLFITYSCCRRPLSPSSSSLIESAVARTCIIEPQGGGGSAGESDAISLLVDGEPFRGPAPFFVTILPSLFTVYGVQPVVKMSSSPHP